MKTRMTRRTIIFVSLTLSIVAVLTSLLGCGKSGDAGKEQASKKANHDVTAESLGFGPTAQNRGTDRMGRLWFRIPVRGPDGREILDQFEDRVYDPKDKRLYRAAIDQKSGETILKALPEITAESLGLEPGMAEMGKDPLGRHWFRIAGSESERRVYDPKAKQLYRATKKPDGDWRFEKIAMPGK
jgi:hypothetical protein